MDHTKKSEGCVALKIAMAYERSLHFEKVTREQAERVFRLKESDITQEDIRCFQDYLFWKICEIAAEVSLPLQCHTGMGQVIDTNILQLNNVIKIIRKRNLCYCIVAFHGWMIFFP